MAVRLTPARPSLRAIDVTEEAPRLVDIQTHPDNAVGDNLTRHCDIGPRHEPSRNLSEIGRGRDKIVVEKLKGIAIIDPFEDLVPLGVRP